MSKKKTKNKKKENSVNYKLFVITGGIFHLIVFLLLDLTLYNDSIFWWSLLFCGLISGIYFIKKMKLLNPDSYRKIRGIKLKLYMFVICMFTIIGTTLIFGNVINGTILGINYLGKSNELNNYNFPIQEITHNKSTGRNRRKRILFRRNNPKVYLEKNGELVGLNLSERYSSNKNYSEFKTIELDLKNGLFGFEVIENYELEK